MDINEAAKKGDLDALRASIKRGDDVNQQAGKFKCTPLIEAAYHGHIDAVKELLSAGATVDLGDKRNSTPLAKAAEQGFIDIVKLILSAGATVDLPDKEGRTPLSQAALIGFIEVVKELHLAGADFDQPDEAGFTPLIWAAMMGHTDLVKFLLSLEADTDAKTYDGKNAYKIAKESDTSNPEVVSLLEPRPEFLRVLPEGWDVFKDKQTKKRMYKKKDIVSSAPPPGNPLFRISTYPPVTFYGEPQEKEFSSSGGHVDFDNGAEITVPPNTVPFGSTVKITVQPSLAPGYDFQLPKKYSSAGPAYLISSEGSTNPDGEISLILEHHVKVSTSKEAEDLVFLQADSTPDRRKVYQFEEVKEGKMDFTQGENKGRLTIKSFSGPKFFRIGFRGGVNKDINREAGGGIFREDSPPPDSPPPDRNFYTVRVYLSSPQANGAQLVIVCISLFGRLYEKFFENVTVPSKYPEVSLKEKVVIKQVQFDEMEWAKLKITTAGESPDKKEDEADTDTGGYYFVAEEPPKEVLVDGWSMIFDKKEVDKDSVDVPETGDYNQEDLHDYPQKLICMFSPDENALDTATCTLFVTGLNPEIQAQIQLNKPKPIAAQVDAAVTP